MNCTICATPLTGGIDTFGDHDQPMCEQDYYALMNEPSVATDDDLLLLGTITRDPDGTIVFRMSDEYARLQDMERES